MNILKHALDKTIILYLIIEICYISYVGMVVFKQPDAGMVLFKNASLIPIEQLWSRRLYFIEGYIAFIALITYLGLRRTIWRWA